MGFRSAGRACQKASPSSPRRCLEARDPRARSGQPLAQYGATGYEATMTSEGPFSGLFVLDLTRILAGPYCTMLLSDLGARVAKVEPPQGDESRRYGPFINGKSGYFTAFNRGKESIALDLKAAGDRAIFERLLGQADVLVENFRPGSMEKLGF